LSDRDCASGEDPVGKGTNDVPLSKGIDPYHLDHQIAIATASKMRLEVQIMRIAALLLSITAWTTVLAAAAENPTLPEGAIVRIQSPQIEAGWHAGRVRTAPTGCHMIELGAPTRAGSGSVALVALERLQSIEPVRWTEVSVTDLIEREPQQCREAAAD
jgi:hypothetical protein